ncbi:hypothetical protein [Acidovorax sp. BLS4]|uniref:hypothetical protein n=1 Tax=Acidovorax sp. BLS4 TaxID=3273430 RepID=UPI002942F4B9|nr:hypothetical protein [Paracidovorax avenae]WOI46516.1 hypothetical protein R1Z03_04675 [Paracidovorax avenae]
MVNFVACKKKVKNRGAAPENFLMELVKWAKSAPDEVFIERPGHEIYAEVAEQLGPYPEQDLTHRKAVLLEVLRVLGGFESSWRWEEGRDVTNPASDKPCTMEAGIFQVSGDSMGFDSSLKTFVKEKIGTLDCEKFRAATKSDHLFAIEYCARLLRFTIRHHGPIRDHHIDEWLSKEAVGEFQAALLESPL